MLTFSMQISGTILLLKKVEPRIDIYRDNRTHIRIFTETGDIMNNIHTSYLSYVQSFTRAVPKQY